MNFPVRDNDFELLSAYLDNQLPERDRRQLEQRLAAEPELKEALAGLRATVRAIRSLPSAKVPRNFTLDARVYGRRPARSFGAAYGLLRLGTALATVFFVVAVAGDYLTRSAAHSLVAPAAAPIAAEQQLAPTETPEFAALAVEAATSSETDEPPRGPTQPTGSLLEGGGRTQGGGGGEDSGGLGGGAPEADASPPPVAFTAPIAPAESAESTPDASRQVEDQVAASQTAQATAQPSSSVKAAPSETETPAAVAQSEAATKLPAPNPPLVAAPSATPIDWLRTAQATLAVLAVGLGLATLWYRSRIR